MADGKEKTRPDGLVERGNIDVNHRPVIWNDDGTPSTIFSATIPIGKGKWALVPTIVNGKFLTPNGKIPKESDKKAMSALEDAASDQYKKSGEHLGIFSSQESADNYANATHAWMPNGGPEKVFTPSYKGESNMPLTREEYEKALSNDQQYTSAQLSDGTTLQFKGQLTPEQVRSKVQDYRLKTGAGMMEHAQDQATASLPKPTEQHDILNPSDPIQKAQDKVYGTKQEGQLTDAPLPFGPSAAEAPLAMIKNVGRSAAVGWAGSELGGRYFGDPGRVIGGLIGGGIGYKSPEIAEWVANRFVGEENVPMWMKSPQSVGRMVSGARDEMYNDLGARRNLPIEPVDVTPQGPARMNAEDIPDPNAYTPQGPTRINPPAKQVDPVLQAVREGRAARMPTRMEPPTVTPMGPTRINETPGGLIPEEPGPVQGPTRVNEADLNQYTPQGPTRINKVGATARTSQLGEPQSGVSVVPEPREALPSDRPGAQWSVPRETLPTAAARGVPGAADVQRQIGNPIIFTPRSGIGYPGPRRFPEEEIPQ